jgi:hypothetical protein
MVGGAGSETRLQPPEFSPVRWLEGTIVDDSAPEYLLPTQRPRGNLDDVDFSKLDVKIGDLGGGMIHLLPYHLNMFNNSVTSCMWSTARSETSNADIVART